MKEIHVQAFQACFVTKHEDLMDKNYFSISIDLAGQKLTLNDLR